MRAWCARSTRVDLSTGCRDRPQKTFLKSYYDHFDVSRILETWKCSPWQNPPPGFRSKQQIQFNRRDLITGARCVMLRQIFVE